MTIAQLPLPDLMRPSAKRAALADEEIGVDLFAGGGGASLAYEKAMGRDVDVAVNHWDAAILCHKRNHPRTEHFQEDVFHVSPTKAVRGRKVGHLHASPDCTHHSNARGRKPVSPRVRGLAWVVVRWAREVRPRVITLENVREFREWGPVIPLIKDGTPILERDGKPAMVPDPARAGVYFRKWVRELEKLGYEVDHRVLDAADYGANTHRKRLYVVARCDGVAIEWPARTHGLLETSHAQEKDHHARSGKARRREPRRATDHELRMYAGREAGGLQCDIQGHASRGKGFRSEGLSSGSVPAARRRKPLKPYRTAAECIDFALPCPSVFLTRDDAAALRKLTGIACKRPLAKKTLWRIANGLVRYVIQAAKPFVVRTGHYSPASGKGGSFRGQGVDEPLGTVCCSNDKGLVAPLISKYNGAESTTHRSDLPLHTLTCIERFAVNPAYLVAVNHGGAEFRGQPADEPIRTLTGAHGAALVAPSLVECANAHWSRGNRAADVPAPTFTAKPRGGSWGVSAAWLVKHYGGVTGHETLRPIGTITATDHHSVGSAFIVRANHGSDHFRGQPLTVPAPTITCSKSAAEARVSLVPLIVGPGGREGQLHAVPGDVPLRTITTKNDKAVAAAFLTKLRGSGGWKPAEKPLDVVCAGAPTFASTLAFITKHNHGEKPCQPVESPLHTITTQSNKHALSAAHVIKFRGDSIGIPADAPLPVITAGSGERPAGAGHALGVAATFLPHYHGEKSGETRGSGFDEPTPTADTSNRFAVVAAFITKFYGTAVGAEMLKPLSTVTAGAGGGHLADVHAKLAGGVDERSLAGFWRVYAFLVEQLGPDAPLPLVTIDGQTYLIVDVGMRMLTPGELLKAQFTPEYAEGYILPAVKDQAVELIGNSVSPPPLIAILRTLHKAAKPRRKVRAA